MSGRISAKEATDLAVKMARRLTRDAHHTPVLVAIFDVDYDGPDAAPDDTRIIVATVPDAPGDAGIMVQALYETMAEKKVRHVCACGRPDCPTVKHANETFSES